MRFNSALQEMNYDLDFGGWCHRRPGDRGGNLEPRLPADEVNGAALAIHAAYTLRLFYKSASLAPTGCADHGQRTSGSTPGRQVDDVLCVRLAKDQHQAHAVSSWAPLRARITVAIVRWSQCWTARYVRQLAGEGLCLPRLSRANEPGGGQLCAANLDQSVRGRRLISARTKALDTRTEHPLPSGYRPA